MPHHSKIQDILYSTISDFKIMAQRLLRRIFQTARTPTSSPQACRLCLGVLPDPRITVLIKGVDRRHRGQRAAANPATVALQQASHILETEGIPKGGIGIAIKWNHGSRKVLRGSHGHQRQAHGRHLMPSIRLG